MKTNALPKMVTTRELATILNVSTERIRQLGNDGVLRHGEKHGEYHLEASVHGFLSKLNADAFGQGAADQIDDLLARAGRCPRQDRHA